MATGRSSWSGALEVSGFPVPVVFYPRVKKLRNESFKTLAPDGKPVHQQYIDSEGKPVEETRKGVEVAKGTYVPMTDEALEAIGEGSRSTLVVPEEFVPLESVPLHFAIERWAVRPNERVPGSEKSVNILWNGLCSTKLAYIAKITTRSGAHDSILAVYADSDGLWAAALPFAAELYDVPATDCFVLDRAAGDLFASFVGARQINNEKTSTAFAHEKFASEYAARREAAIAAVLAGESVPVAKTTPTATVDLMAALEASVKAAKPKTKAPAKKPVARRKVTA
jgi:non-homologous end joining protein Ku